MTFGICQIIVSPYRRSPPGRRRGEPRGKHIRHYAERAARRQSVRDEAERLIADGIGPAIAAIESLLAAYTSERPEAVDSLQGVLYAVEDLRDALGEVSVPHVVAAILGDDEQDMLGGWEDAL